MCGIIGIVGEAPVTPLLVEALKRLEYRGYDSAGVATLVNGHMRRRENAKLGVESTMRFERIVRSATKYLQRFIGLSATPASRLLDEAEFS